MSRELSYAKAHLTSISQGAQILKGRIEQRSSEEATDFLELIRHIHGAIEELASAVENLERK